MEIIMTTGLFPKRPYTVAVIGGASGIGRATALHLARQGVTAIAVDRDEAGARETVRLMGNGSAIAADVTSPASMQSCLARIENEHSVLHGLVNCAGITGKTNLKAHEVELADFDAVYRVNLRGALIASQAVLPGMLRNNYGRILHVASIAGKEGNAGMTAYSATKAGLIGLVKSMGKDYAETGVTINALAPAVILTPLVEALPQATVDYMTAKIPMRRCGSLDEVAAMIAWTVSPACSFTTGFTFDLSGGRATY